VVSGGWATGIAQVCQSAGHLWRLATAEQEAPLLGFLQPSCLPLMSRVAGVAPTARGVVLLVAVGG
jgi:hypothetical protein